MIRLLVCGSRTLEDKQNYIQATLEKLVGHNHIDSLICGMARGADIIAYYYFHAKGTKILEYPADWSVGKKGGILRNIKMLEDGKPTHIIAFIDQRDPKNPSKGTNHMINIAKEKGIPVKIIYVK